MTTKIKFRIVAVCAVFTLLLGIYSARLWPASETGTDFYVFYTAACLIRSHQSMQIYDQAERNMNPQLMPADPASAYAQTARARGVPGILYRYLYPPTLADLMVPLTVLSPSTALIAWNVLRILLIVGLSMILTRMLGLHFFGAIVLVAVAILLFRPTLNSIHWGQISILLALLLTAGLSLSVRGHRNVAALLFALAIAIKLEPMIIIIPLIAWRDWKCLRGLAVWCAGLGLGLWAVNGSSTLSFYFLHQLPAMSGGDLGTGIFEFNRSLGNVFYRYLGGAHPIVSSDGLAWLVRAVSALILCYAGWLSRLKPGENPTNRQQFEVGMMFLLFACCLSPYSWLYNWALSAPVLVIFCKRVWDGRAGMAETALLIAFLLSLATSKLNMSMVTPVLGVALGIVVLHKMRLERCSGEGKNPISQLEQNPNNSAQAKNVQGGFFLRKKPLKRGTSGYIYLDSAVTAVSAS